MIISIKVEPFIRKKDSEAYPTHLIVDEDALLQEDGRSEIMMKTNEGLDITFAVDTKDLYQLALVIVNKMENADNNKN